MRQAAVNVKGAESSVQQPIQDYLALAGAALNILVGFMTIYMLCGGISLKLAFLLVGTQMMVQLVLVPLILRHTFDLFRPTIEDVVDTIRLVVSNLWQCCNHTFFVVATQLMVRLLLVLIILEHTFEFLRLTIDDVVDKIRSVVSDLWQLCHCCQLNLNGTIRSIAHHKCLRLSNVRFITFI